MLTGASEDAAGGVVKFSTMEKPAVYIAAAAARRQGAVFSGVRLLAAVDCMMSAA
jgi:hypothetical protein